MLDLAEEGSNRPEGVNVFGLADHGIPLDHRHGATQGRDRHCQTEGPHHCAEHGCRSGPATSNDHQHRREDHDDYHGCGRQRIQLLPPVRAQFATEFPRQRGVRKSRSRDGGDVGSHGQADQDANEQDDSAENREHRPDPVAPADLGSLDFLPAVARRAAWLGCYNRGRNGTKFVLIFPHYQRPTLLVGELPGQNENDIHQLAYAQQSAGKQPEDARADLADVESLQAANAKNPAQAQQARVEAFAR